MGKVKPRKTAAQVAAERRAADLVAVSLPAEAASLPRQASIEVTRAGESRAKSTDDKKVSHDSARRIDAFDALKSGFAHGCYDAVRRFEVDLLARLGIWDRVFMVGRVDCDRDPHYARALACAVAGEKVDAIKARIPPRDFDLLCELIAPQVDRGTWRDHVAYITRERHTEGQSAAVRAACVNLRDAYAAMERKAA
jgi:hypothetical protein